MFEVALIGAGNMATEIGKRLIRYAGFNPEQIVATHYDLQKAEVFQKKTGIQTVLDNKWAVERSKIIVLCVRPQQVKNVIYEISPGFHYEQSTLVNIAVGVKLSWLAKSLNTSQIIHFHPTSMLMVSDQWNPGISLWVAHPEINHEHNKRIRAIFEKAIGEIWTVSEKNLPFLIFAVGNSPAYLIRIIKSFVENVLKETPDIDAWEVYRIITKSLYTGLVSERKNADQIIERIATKQGVTQTGLKFLESVIDPVIQDLIKVTIQRIKEIESTILEG